MSWPAGKARGKKTGGRKKGTPNKRTAMLSEEFEKIGLHIPSHLSKLLPALSPKDQVDVLLKLMDFLYPKRKPCSVAPETGKKSLHDEILEYIEGN
ncbi:MAG: hypothetical protein HYW48_07290 [Deltaproteobacteria bacterium]|nr:hypothetical protein [Deltaproteobacteria bacterium]